MTKIKGIPELIILTAAGLALLSHCTPAPAQTLRDPFYTTYPFQTPAQASRQLNAERDARRYQERQLDAIEAAARRVEEAAERREFQRRLEEVQRGR